MAAKPFLALLLLSTLALAGCSAGGDTPEEQAADDLAGDAPEVEVTETTGGIRGVVVDEAVRPIKGARVEVTGTDKAFTTDESGLFAFSGLEEGTYFVKASHPLYGAVQQEAEVRAGVADPKPLKFLLPRVIEETPFVETLKYEGFIVCSTNAVLPLVGGVLSEECGEGVGVPCVAPPAPCGRVGGQSNNNVQFDFSVGPGAKTIVVEQVWEPTSDAGKAFYTPVSLDWVCDPLCGGQTFLEMQGVSPLLGRIDNSTIDSLNLTSGQTISTFTWASPDTTPIGVVLNQQYTIFVNTFYFLPAPADWSFVRGDPKPF